MDPQKPPNNRNKPQPKKPDATSTPASNNQANRQGSTNIPPAPSHSTQHGTLNPLANAPAAQPGPPAQTATLRADTATFVPRDEYGVFPAWNTAPHNPPPPRVNYPTVRFDALGEPTRVGGPPGAIMNDLSPRVRGTVASVGNGVHTTNRTPVGELQSVIRDNMHWRDRTPAVASDGSVAKRDGDAESETKQDRNVPD
jgi:hypothetical protein